MSQNPYSIDITERNIRPPIVSLKLMYEQIPETTGCEKCKEINGDKSEWCCKTNTPSAFYVEFLHVWEQVQQWKKEDKVDLVLRAIKNYLINGTQKSCPFFDDGCTCYSERFLACRMYGIIPQSSWEKRVNYLKERDGDNANVPNQCNLVSTKNNEIITEKQDKNWFLHSATCEVRLGIPKKVIIEHDNEDGSYRAIHDHILLEMFSPKFLEKLTQIKLQNSSADDIDKFLGVLKQQINEII